MTNYARTHNEGLTHVTSGNPLVDLFSVIGTRSKDFSEMFGKAFGKDKEKAMRILMWVRDIREGAGERDTSRTLLKYLEKHHPAELETMIPHWPEYGRWDDLLIFENPSVKKKAFETIKEALEKKNGLCAKWMPRQKGVANELRKFMGMKPKEYRKMLVENTSVVESLMCTKQWGEINYSHVPSVASSRYQKAFGRNDTKRYTDYLNALKTGAPGVKINASALYPYDVIRGLYRGDVKASTAQWEALPNYMGDNKILPMVDVSGSMGGLYPSGNNITPMLIAVSLGLYVADKQTGDFKDLYLTFSSHPELFKLRGNDISQKVRNLQAAKWEMTTNIEAAFAKVLDFAITNKVKPDDMPKMLMVISDMEFNQATRSNTPTFDNAKKMFEDAGYKIPRVVFWNVNGRDNNFPVKITEDGTALISGFSPAIMKSLLSDNLKEFTPEAIMNETIMKDRYNIWK